MINLTTRKSKRLWQAEVERMMLSLHYGIAKDWNRSLTSQFFRASKFAKAGRFDDIIFIVDDARLNMIYMLKNHYRRVANVFSRKVFGAVVEKKFIGPSEIKSPKEDFWKELNRWMTTQAADKVTKVSKTTKKTLARIIHKGQQDKLSHVEIAKNIRATGKITNPHRARTIALTETHTASVKSMDAAIKSTRIEMEREWVSARDTRTRRPSETIFNHFSDFPAGANGERVAQNQAFVGTGEPLMYPGDPKGSAGNVIRCRCCVLYHTVSVMDKERLKPYKPEGDFGEIITGSPVKSSGDILDHYKNSANAAYYEGKKPSELKKDIAERIGTKMWKLKTNEMDDFVRYACRTEEFRETELIDYKHAVKNLVRQWAMTSGDSKAKSIMLQLAAKAEFHLDGTSIWWKNEVLKEAQTLFDKHGKSARQFLRLIYDDTQKYLKKKGLKTVRVFRGYQGSIDGKFSTVKNPIGKTKVQLQPMSSFSSDWREANRFATRSAHKDTVMFYSEVPSERIISCPVTGFGCKDEVEYVVLGAQKYGGEDVLFSYVSKSDTGKLSFWEKLFGLTGEVTSDDLLSAMADNIHKITK